MFDIGWPELFLIAVVVLLVVGPKELPKVLRNVGIWVGKAKVVTREFRTHVDDMIRDSELEEVRGQINSASQMNLDTITENSIDLQDDIEDVIVRDPDGGILETNFEGDVNTKNNAGDIEDSGNTVENHENGGAESNDVTLDSIKSNTN